MKIKPEKLRKLIEEANKLGLKKTHVYSFDVRKMTFTIGTEFGPREIKAGV